MKTKTFAAVVALILAAITGCITKVDVVVDPVKPWEGHYVTTEEFKEKTAEIQLDEGESIWVISNNTLKRVLRNQLDRAK